MYDRKAQIYYPRHIYMSELRVHYKLLVERSQCYRHYNYCPDYYPRYMYRIVQNFDRGKLDVFDAFKLDRQNLTHQMVLKQYNVYRCMVKDDNHLSKYFPSHIWSQYLSQFPPIKILCYMVSIYDWAYDNRPCERKLHWVIFSLISFVPSTLSHFRKMQKKAH